MEIPKDIEEDILKKYPELEGKITLEFVMASNALGMARQVLDNMGIKACSAVVTHVGKVENGVLFGITMRSFNNPEVAQESYKKAQHRPVLLIF